MPCAYDRSGFATCLEPSLCLRQLTINFGTNQAAKQKTTRRVGGWFLWGRPLVGRLRLSTKVGRGLFLAFLFALLALLVLLGLLL